MSIFENDGRRRSVKERIPVGLFEKGKEMSSMSGLPRTKALGILSEGISLPTRVEQKGKKIKLIWEREFNFK